MQIIGFCPHMPLIPMRYDPNLLSISTFVFNAEHLLKVAQWLEKKILSAEFRKYPVTIMRIREQIKYFMELYDRAKDQEREAKGKTLVKANQLFYRPRLSNKNDQRVFERLVDRSKINEYNRRNSNISKVQG